MPDAFDPLTHRGPLPSPCISLCRMSPDTALCEGCQRTLDEITLWSRASEARKRGIWLAILERRKTIGCMAGGVGDVAPGDGR